VKERLLGLKCELLADKWFNGGQCWTGYSRLFENIKQFSWKPNETTNV